MEGPAVARRPRWPAFPPLALRDRAWPNWSATMGRSRLAPQLYGGSERTGLAAARSPGGFGLPRLLGFPGWAWAAHPNRAMSTAHWRWPPRVGATEGGADARSQGEAGPGRAHSPFAARDACMRKWARGRDSRLVCSGAGSPEDGCPLRAAGESCGGVGWNGRGGAGVTAPLRGIGRPRG